MATKKRVAGVFTVLLLVLLLLLSPFATGMWYQRFESQIFSNALDNLRMASGPGLSTVADNISIQRTGGHLGWLSSDTVWTVSAKEGTAPALIIRTHVSHGPLVVDPVSGKWKIALATFSSEGQFTLPPESPVHLANPFVTANGLIGFSGMTHAVYNVPGISGEASGLRYRWDGLQIDSHLQVSLVNPGNLKKIQTNISLGKMELLPSASHTELPTVHFSGGVITNQGSNVTSLLKTHDISDGEVTLEMNLPSLSVSIVSPASSVVMENLALNGKVSVISGKFGETVRLGLGNLQVKSPEFADFSMTDSMVDFAIENLNGAAFNDLVQKIQLAKNQEESQQIFQTLFPKTLNHDSSLTTSLHFNSSMGNMTGKGNLRWKSETRPASLADLQTGAVATLDVQLSDTLLKNLQNMSIELSIPKIMEQQAARQKEASAEADANTPAVDSSAQRLTPEKIREQLTAEYTKQLDALVKQGFITHQGNNYTISLHYEDGTLKANGIAISTP